MKKKNRSTSFPTYTRPFQLEMTVDAFRGLRYFIAPKRNLSLSRHDLDLYDQVWFFFFLFAFISGVFFFFV